MGLEPALMDGTRERAYNSGALWARIVHLIPGTELQYNSYVLATAIKIKKKSKVILHLTVRPVTCD